MSCIYCVSTLGLLLQGSVNPLVMSHEESAFVASELSARILQLQRRRQARLTSVVIDDLRGRYRANVDRCNDFYVAIVTVAAEVPYFASQIAAVVKTLLATVGATDCASVQVSVRAHFLLEEIAHCDSAIDPARLTAVADVLAVRGPLGPSTDVATFLHRSVGGVDLEGGSSAGGAGSSSGKGHHDAKPEATLQDSAFAFPDDGVAAAPEVEFDANLHAVRSGTASTRQMSRNRTPAPVSPTTAAAPASAHSSPSALASAAAGLTSAANERMQAAASAAAASAAAAAAAARPSPSPQPGPAPESVPKPAPKPTLDDVFGNDFAPTPSPAAPASKAASSSPPPAAAAAGASRPPRSALDDIDEDFPTAEAAAPAPAAPAAPAKAPPAKKQGDFFDDWFSGAPAAPAAGSTQPKVTAAATPAATADDLFGPPPPTAAAGTSPPKEEHPEGPRDPVPQPSASEPRAPEPSAPEPPAPEPPAPSESPCIFYKSPAAVHADPVAGFDDPHDHQPEHEAARTSLGASPAVRSASVADRANTPPITALDPQPAGSTATSRQSSSPSHAAAAGGQVHDEPSPIVPMAAPEAASAAAAPPELEREPSLATSPSTNTAGASAAPPAGAPPAEPVRVMLLVGTEAGRFRVGAIATPGAPAVDIAFGNLEAGDGSEPAPDAVRVRCSGEQPAWLPASVATLPQDVVPALAEMTATRSGDDVVVKVYYAWNPAHPPPRRLDVVVPIPAGTKALVRPAPNATVASDRVTWHVVVDGEERVSASTLMAAKLSGPGVAAGSEFRKVTAQLDWDLAAAVVPVSASSRGGEPVPVLGVESRSEGFHVTADL